MALFIFGAGATRGASFVDPKHDPCLPPLDGDFYKQLQRIRNQKHQKLIDSVINDTVEIFGSNFDTTLEAAFTTLEHTSRMLGTTGDNRAFRSKDIKDKRERLKQAVAAVFEESLTESHDNGDSTHEHKRCSLHDEFVKNVLKPGDAIIGFNYDCVLDDSLKREGHRKWNPRYGYGFNLGPRGKRLQGDGYWSPSKPASQTNTVKFLKLHGSLNFQVTEGAGGPSVYLKKLPYTKRKGNMRFTIIPPEWHKNYDSGVFLNLWKNAATAINKTQHLVLIGYSLPPTDLHSTALFRTAIRKNSLKSLVVVNPDREARKRIRDVLQRGVHNSTRIHSFDSFDDFLATNPDLWRR